MKAILIIEMPENCTECPLEMDVADTGMRGKGISAAAAGIEMRTCIRSRDGVRWYRCRILRKPCGSRHKRGI